MIVPFQLSLIISLVWSNKILVFAQSISTFL